MAAQRASDSNGAAKISTSGQTSNALQRGCNGGVTRHRAAVRWGPLGLSEFNTEKEQETETPLTGRLLMKQAARVPLLGPLVSIRSPSGGRCLRCRLRSSLTHPQVRSLRPGLPGQCSAPPRSRPSDGDRVAWPSDGDRGAWRADVDRVRGGSVSRRRASLSPALLAHVGALNDSRWVRWPASLCLATSNADPRRPDHAGLEA